MTSLFYDSTLEEMLSQTFLFTQHFRENANQEAIVHRFYVPAWEISNTFLFIGTNLLYLLRKKRMTCYGMCTPLFLSHVEEKPVPLREGGSKVTYSGVYITRKDILNVAISRPSLTQSVCNTSRAGIGLKFGMLGIQESGKIGRDIRKR